MSSLSMMEVYSDDEALAPDEDNPASGGYVTHGRGLMAA